MDYDLRKLQSIILYIAKEIKRVCDKNEIDYTMIGGTLIGAVRHNGFIPWDDDADVAFTRNQLLDRIWGGDYGGETRTVDVHVARIRKKLGWQDIIRTVPRIGYRLEVTE